MNPERGEVAVMLEGREYVMRPSWTALKSIEQKLAPKTLIQLMTEFGDRAISASEAEVIVTAGIKAYGLEMGDEMLKAYREDRVGEMIFNSGGVAAVMGPILQFIMNISGGSEKKKPEAEQSSS